MFSFTTFLSKTSTYTKTTIVNAFIETLALRLEEIRNLVPIIYIRLYPFY